MFMKRTLTILLIAFTILLATGITSRFAWAARTPSGVQPAEITIPYAGSLAMSTGQPAAEGVYDFRFALYRGETGGTPLWTETQTGVTVTQGAFAVLLGKTTPLSSAALGENNLWLEVNVRGPGEADFTLLDPRQPMGRAKPASSPIAAACAHTHWGESWTGLSGDGLNIAFPFSGPSVTLAGSDGTAVDAMGQVNNGIGVRAVGSGAGNARPALYAENTNLTGGIAAYFKGSSMNPNAEFDEYGTGTILDLQTFVPMGPGKFIAGYGPGGVSDERFSIAGTGEGFSKVGWSTFSQDFAELLPAVVGLEPGDVLVIGPDGILILSTTSYQTSVAGVYSTQPGFVGGQPVDGQLEGAIPLAMVGVVPVKVTAENGPIHPGDLLVTSARPGYAMVAGLNPPQGTVIGKALEALPDGVGVIKVLVTLQ